MANGFAKVKDINEAKIVKCAIHDKEIKDNANDINNIGGIVSNIYKALITIGILLVIDLGAKAVPFLIRALTVI